MGWRYLYLCKRFGKSRHGPTFYEIFLIYPAYIFYFHTKFKKIIMATVTLKGNPINTIGTLPESGSKAPGFSLTKGDLSSTQLDEYKGAKVVLNIFPKSLNCGEAQ